jgi:hypothetical protein
MTCILGREGAVIIPEPPGLLRAGAGRRALILGIAALQSKDFIIFRGVVARNNEACWRQSRLPNQVDIALVRIFSFTN